jgi:hypothetical protein
VPAEADQPLQAAAVTAERAERIISWAEQAIASDDAEDSAKTLSPRPAMPAYSATRPGRVVLAQNETFPFPSSSVGPEFGTGESAHVERVPAAAAEIIDEAGIDERIKGLTIDIRPRTSLTSERAGELVNEAELFGRSHASLDSSLAYTRTAGPGPVLRSMRYREFVWAAPNFFHRPLYFEQKNLERYGYHYGGPCLQSAVSAAHFFGTIPLLPYKVAVQRPRECDYTLGHYRPGDCAPNRITCCEFDLNALAIEGAVATGCAVILF